MNSTTFFRLALLLPIALPLALLPFGLNVVSGTLFLALCFGGVQYVLFAAAMFVIVGRLRTSKALIRLCVWAPVMFLPVLLLGWFIYAATQPGETADASSGLPLLVYELIVGYCFVGMTLLVYFYTKAWGLVHDEALPQA
jgi:hypothetical protein